MFVKFLIHLTVLEILGKLVGDVFLFINMYFSCSNGGCNLCKIALFYNVLRSIGAHARNNFTRALNYAHPYG